MATLQEMKQELETAVQDKSLLNNIQAELAKMETTEGLDGKPILEKFYKLWKDSGGKKGQRNEINSWTAFALGMTEKKPEDGSTFLQKRRAFARKGFPDIDSDFDYEHRDDIYKYIIDTYGREHVGNIGTYSGLKMKSFVRRAVKAIDPERTFFKGFDEWKTATNALGEDILTALPPQYGAFLKVKGSDGQEHAIKTVEDATKWCKNFAFYINKYPAILEHSRNIEGLLSTFGVHAAGIVISSEPLGCIAPLRQTKMLSTDEFQTGPKYAYATQFEYNDLEFLGLIKFDILALSTLSVIRRCCQEVEKNYPGIKIDIENLPLDDAKTYKLYKSGKLTGVFQCEEHGMQRTMVNMGVDSIDDIMAGIALYRPGPMDSIPTYCARKHGSETLDYFHPSLKKFIEPYVKKTYGLLVYQEQVMTICNSIAGFSIPEGYVVIKAIGKKQRDLLQKYREKFISGAEKNGIQGKIAADYWDKVITPFADYGFNKAHACCYAYNSYITAYLKANYPEEFVTAYLNVEVGRSNYDKVSVLEKMAEDMDIDIAPRHINDCKLEYRIIARADAAQGVGKSQICPSVKCKGLSDNAAHEIVSKQPYSSLADFAAKTDTKIVDMRAVEALVEAGFFRPKTGRGRGKDAIIAEFEVIREDLKKAKKRGVETGNIFA